MHDPEVVAWEIHLPIPHFRWKQYPGGPRNEFKRWRRTNAENLGEPVRPWWKPSGYDVTILGRKVKWRTLVTIWHVEPGGADMGTVCPHRVSWEDEHGKRHYRPVRTWKWHVHHWQVQLHPWQKFKRWAFTRCAWCGGRSTNRDPVNCSMQWEGPRAKHWWQSEPDLFHGDCSTVFSAHRTCQCPDPLLSNNGYGRCAICGGFRAWRSKTDPVIPEREDAVRILKTIPKGGRMTPEIKAAVEPLWKAAREQAEARR